MRNGQILPLKTDPMCVRSDIPGISSGLSDLSQNGSARSAITTKWNDGHDSKISVSQFNRNTERVTSIWLYTGGEALGDSRKIALK